MDFISGLTCQELNNPGAGSPTSSTRIRVSTQGSRIKTSLIARGCHGTPRLTAEPTAISFKAPPYFGVGVVCLAARGVVLAGVETAGAAVAVLAGGGGAEEVAGAGEVEEPQPITSKEHRSRIVRGIHNLFIYLLLSIFF